MSDDRFHSGDAFLWRLGTVMSTGPTGPAHKLPGLSGQQKAVLAVIGVAAATRMARDRKTYERAIVFALVLAAAAGLARAGQVRSISRLMAWDKQRTLADLRRPTKQVRFPLSSFARRFPATPNSPAMHGVPRL
jgi:hypothetical protein